MLLSYLKLSLRLLVRNPFFTTINVVGLAIGFASFYALWEYSTTELKADQYHKDADRIARIGVNWNWTDDGGKTWGHITFGFTKSSMFPKVKEDFPEVESSLRILNQGNFSSDLVNHGNKIIISTNEQNGQRIFKEEKTAYADPNLFTFFTIPLVYGQPDKVLNEANYVVLSQSTAVKYFGKTDPVGELLKLNDSITLKVSGVYEDLPHYSHLNFELVISNAGLQNKWSSPHWSGLVGYIKLNHQDFKNFEAKLNRRLDQYWRETLRNWSNIKLDMFVQPLADISFSQNFEGDNFYSKSKPFLFTLVFIALSILVMAWVNYINLSVTRTSRRFKEIATRKISGAGAVDMVWQFVTQSLVTNMLAIALAFTLIQLIRKPASLLFNIQIDEFSSLSLGSVTIFLSIIISGIFLSGLYPAIISMAYQPKELFNFNPSVSGRRFIPSLLTIGQLSVAIIFILLGFTVAHQLNHVLNMSTGINKNDVVIIEAPVIKPANYHQILLSLENQISNNANVSAVTCSSSDVSEYFGAEQLSTRRIGSDLKFGIKGNTVDEDFLPFYGITLLAGRNFIKDNQPDAIIISRFAATRLGFKSPEDAIGSIINLALDNGPNGDNLKDAEVIGVFEDFRLASFLNMSQSSTEANDQGAGFILMYKDQFFGGVISTPEKISVRVSPQNFKETIASIQTLFEQQFPGNAFTWYFLDEHVNQIYSHEKVSRNQIVLFTVLALLIACLGLLGMISKKVVEKTKEIGIRKVMGAELHQIAQILLNTTAKQIIIATVIGIPVAYYLTQQYLEKFSERITLQWWHFALPVLILVVIMFLTIASVLWKAAKSNPVEALKYE